MPALFILHKSADQQYYFNLTAQNNEIILTSETYTSKGGAIYGIQSVRENSPSESRYSRFTSEDGQYYFLLKGANNETIGKSETYTTHQAREKGIQAVKKVGLTAPLSDKT
ncbi:MAG: hypothetical protein A2136_09415 [Chloroflexi bacterium RBG_16_54_11]|nr:MAG: hypothetical protein A2136_09415 [Chloroflexi bacterium RBG_16_54_11]